MGAIAIVDAAVFYGAQRILDGVKDERFRLNDDRELFIQFLHFAVLYDTLLLDNSSLASAEDRSFDEDSQVRILALTEFIKSLNRNFGSEFIETDAYGFSRGGGAKSFELGLEFRDAYSEVARLVAEAVSDPETARRLRELGVPWAYRDDRHYDWISFGEAAESAGLAREWIPFAIFAWRGLWYTGLAGLVARERGRSVAYAAAPRRIAIMQELWSTDGSPTLREGHRKSIARIREMLPELPTRFNFSDIPQISPFRSTPIGQIAAENEPQLALKAVLDIRRSRPKLRDWWERELFPSPDVSTIVADEKTIARGSNSVLDLPSTAAGRIKVEALILKGGGVKGLAFAGAMQELENYFEFSAFVGTSAGGLAAALLGAGATGVDLEADLKKTSFREFLDGNIYFPYQILTHWGLHPGIALTDWLRSLLSKYTGRLSDVTMADLLPKRVVVYASSRSGPITFDSSGEHDDTEVHAAVRCSLSIPFFFQPPKVDLRYAYDGGWGNNFPVKTFLDQERASGRKTEPSFVALYIGSTEQRSIKSRGPIVELIESQIDGSDLKLIDKYRSKVVLIETNPIGTIDFDLSNAEKDFLVLAGRLGALKFLRDEKVQTNSAAIGPLENQVGILRATLVKAREERRRRRALLLIGGIALVAVAIGFESWISRLDCPPRRLGAVTFQEGNNKQQYRVQADFTRGQEKSDPRACGREHWEAQDTKNTYSGKKWVYLLDKNGQRISNRLYFENPDDSLRLSDE
jgi:hypothetical protein